MLDMSSLEPFCECPYKGFLKIVKRKKRVSPDAALRYGGCVHTAMACRYRHLYYARERSVAWLERVDSICQRVLAHAFEHAPTPNEDWRDLNQASNLFKRYSDVYNVDGDWRVADLNCYPFVEKPFVINMDKVLDVQVFFIGRIDLVIRDVRDQLYLVDHKTTSMLGDSYWADKKASLQMRGYSYVLHKLGMEPNGFIINTLVGRKPTKTGVSCDVERRTFYLERDWQDLFYDTFRKLAWTFITHHKHDIWPQYRNACVGKYRTCEFYDLCQMHPHTHKEELASHLYETNTWSPLKKPELHV